MCDVEDSSHDSWLERIGKRFFLSME